ncbi:hypothetical protein [Rufibacter sp. XAAS-G3-1]|uniref:hypothetical protein n=1 Tax=Rufibacter sp. XAAS-G3-1 TaxID=2729134 RepID=UPI0015E6A07E|nr:hypothetical protein [Rufibacter sp. XAAS-G3-1]
MTNQHWVSVNEIDAFKTVYIFRGNSQLIISENGKVTRGSWEYLSHNSIIIERQEESYLFKHGFLDESVLALKVDGLNEYAVFVNETKYGNEINNINDLIKFLEAKYTLKEKQNLSNRSTQPINDNRLGNVELVNGDSITFYPTEKNQTTIIEGCKVLINGQKPQDGLYKSILNTRYEVVDGILHKEYRIEKHTQSNGAVIEIDNYRMQTSKKGNRVWLNDNPAPDGEYKTGIFSSSTVSNGLIV